MKFRWLICLIMLFTFVPVAYPANPVDPEPEIKPATGPLFGRHRLRTFVLGNFDRFANLKQPLPALSADSLNFVSQSHRPDDVTFILESFAGLFPGVGNEKTDNVIEIVDADDLSAAIAEKIGTVDPSTAQAIRAGISDRTLCWSGKLPTPEKDVPIILVSQLSDKAFLSKCLYRGVMAQMGVFTLFKDRHPVNGGLDAILSHMANVTAMHIFFECREHIRGRDFRQGRRCVERRFDARY